MRHICPSLFYIKERYATPSKQQPDMLMLLHINAVALWLNKYSRQMTLNTNCNRKYKKIPLPD